MHSPAYKATVALKAEGMVAQPAASYYTKAKVECAFAGLEEFGWEARRSEWALDCRIVRQRRLTSSFRLDSPARNLPTLSRTASLLPRYRFPVAPPLSPIPRPSHRG